ncbi:MAG: NAD(P)H-hydrate dehydratase [Alphaproteobacteria bacterium]|nr:NAD(P)H-hydrate dehydratase [Alphaproteobacteria bacterium]
MSQELLTVELMKLAEAKAKALGLSEEDLMKRAGKAVAEVILSQFSPRRVLVFCGPGKNGGDGRVVAHLLKAENWSVEVITTNNLPQISKLEEVLQEADLVVDGIFGAGLSQPLGGDILSLVHLINTSGKPVIAIDIPTGIETNSGQCYGAAIKATHTVTFFRARVGHYLVPGRLFCGKLFVKDIGITEPLLSQPNIFLNAPSLWVNSLKEPQPTDHKYSRGSCLIVGTGSMPGAVRLASLAARRIGAGLVRLMCKMEEYPTFAAIAWGDIVTPLGSAQEFLDWILDGHFHSLLWGTGALPQESTRQQAILLLESKKPCVLDGGALSSFEGHTLELTGHLHENAILTPHEGEFQRLFPHLAFLKNKVEKAHKAAVEVGSIIVLKGYDTIIASPKGEIIINSNAPATLSTAGTGDVLAGLMAGLLAQAIDPFQAAAAAVWIHGEAANRIGLGLIAEDLLGEIPRILQFLSTLRSEKPSLLCE